MPRPTSLTALALTLAVSGCAMMAPVTPVPVPPERPDGLRAPVAQAVAVPLPSAQSEALAAYYRRFEASQVARGLLRTDGGGPDTPFNARMLQENFERIAFFDEYERGAGLRQGSDTPGRLRRWSEPIRFTVEHGDWATEAVKEADRSEVAAYVARLRRITGHPMSVSEADPNFHIIYASVDEKEALAARIEAIVPNVNPASLSIFEDLPRNIHCLVIAFSKSAESDEYARAIAVIRAEHPPLMRRSCIHEEIAQGLGLANDSPQARPSIFNDDDEFALLTTHDEMLLTILYDPALQPGMTLDEARPVIRQRANMLVAAQSG